MDDGAELGGDLVEGVGVAGVCVANEGAGDGEGRTAEMPAGTWVVICGTDSPRRRRQ